MGDVISIKRNSGETRLIGGLPDEVIDAIVESEIKDMCTSPTGMYRIVRFHPTLISRGRDYDSAFRAISLARRYSEEYYPARYRVFDDRGQVVDEGHLRPKL